MGERFVSFPQDQVELYTEFGITAEKAQVLEVEAGNVALTFVTLFFDTSRIGAEEREFFRHLVDDVNSKTLGALLRSIKTWAKFDERLLQIVDEGLERRNYLAHRFFPSHNFAIFSETGRRVMIEELKAIQMKLDRAHSALSAVSASLEQFAGRKDLAAEVAEKFIREGKRLNL
jgi:hypothetical protein